MVTLFITPVTKSHDRLSKDSYIKAVGPKDPTISGLGAVVMPLGNIEEHTLHCSRIPYIV